ncbi:MAG: LysM peptidoglycan-binding domain-containing protein [Chitinophagaceae bacterium]|nr:LysM peptidoglycan-binding domain-containing protein [Chitinophagaceae bacterium]
MIKLRHLVFYLFIFLARASVAQSGLVIQGISPDLHLLHTIGTKDTWYSLGRLYNINPKELATYNRTTIDKPLSASQPMKVPLTSVNFSQNGSKDADEVFVPLYHTVQPKEWMYRISVNHNKVPIETLEKWNNISRDNATAGTRLIVGYLKVKQSQSALAGGGVNNVSSSPVPVVTKEPAAPKKEEIAKKPEPVKQEAARNEETIKKEEPVRKTESPVVTESKKEDMAESRNNAAVNFKGGYFKTQYDASGKSATGVSGIFKSTSGWNDGKYYALMNNVPVGTIVRVNFPSTNKNIYAKVLGTLPDMKESTGLTIRISDAAATELGAGNAKFTVDVKY